MVRRRIAIGCCAPLPKGVGADGRWSPPGIDDVEVLFTGRHDPDADDWTSVDPDADLAAELAAVGWDRVDLYVGDIAEYRPLPARVREVADRAALLVGDWNMAGQLLHDARDIVDVIVCDHAGVEAVTHLGHTAIPTLVWGVREEWPWVDPAAPRDIDVLFIGSTNAAIHQRRNGWLLRLGELADRCDVTIRTRLYGPAYREHIGRAKLVFNHSVRGEANIRSYEGAVAGACVLNERGNVELQHVFDAGADYATYDEHDLAEVVLGLLADDERRLSIARAGQHAARTHTITDHLTRRIRDLVAWLATDPPRPPAATCEDWDRLAQRQWLLGASRRAWSSAGNRHAQLTIDPAGLERARLHAAAAATARAAPTDLAGAFDAGMRLVDSGAADVGDLLALVDVADAAGDLVRARELAAMAAASQAPPARPVRYVAAGWNAWRGELERRLLQETDPAHRIAESQAVAAARARYEHAIRSEYELTLEQRIAALGSVDVEVASVHLLHGLLHADLGRHDIARDSLLHAAQLEPLAPEAWVAWTHACLACGEVDEPRRTLERIVRALSAMPDYEAAHERLAQLLHALPERAPRIALAYVDPNEPGAGALLDAVLVWWARHPPAATTLRIACPDSATGQQLVAAVTAALARCGIDPDALPDTEVFGAVRAESLASLVGSSVLVVDDPAAASPATRLAARLDRPRLDPTGSVTSSDPASRRARPAAWSDQHR